MEIRKVKNEQLKFDRNFLQVSNNVSVDVPVIVDQELNVIFGDAAAMKSKELEVLVVEGDWKVLRMAIHSIGRWAEPNWKELSENDPPKFGYTAFISDYLFKEVPKQLGIDKHPDVDESDFGSLF